MQNSSPDKVAFTMELWRRVEAVTNRMAKKRGLVEIPPRILDAMKKARPMALRFQKGDRRHTESEMQYEQEVADWLVEQWAKLHGNPVPPKKYGPHN